MHDTTFSTARVSASPVLRAGILQHAVLALLFSVSIWTYIQFATPHLVDNDGYYHIKMAALIREHGLPVHFPWLKLTLLDESGYTDHHMLMHVFQIPFTYLNDLRLAAKWSAIAFATFAFICFYWVVWRYEIRYPLLWLLLLVASSHAFLFRMSMPRGQSLSLGFQLIAFHFLMTRNRLGLVSVSALFVWAYNAFTILIPLVGVGVIAHYIVERRVASSLLLAVGGGMLLALVIHPYFPRDILFLWNHIVPKLFATEYGTSVGAEWYPYTSWVLVTNAPLALIAYVTAIAITNREEWTHDLPRLYWALVATMYLVLLLKSRRFVEYFPPAAILFLAFAVRGWLARVDWSAITFSPIRFGSTVCASLLLLWSCQVAIATVRNEIANSAATDLYRGGAEWLATHTPANTMVFHTDWDDFPMLFFFNTHNTYVVGLDPDFMRLKDERRFRLWEAITRGEIPAFEDSILKDFGCEYVFTDNEHHEFIALAQRSPRMEKVYTDTNVTIYRVLANSLFLDPATR